jgi:hypothetical protein
MPKHADTALQKALNRYSAAHRIRQKGHLCVGLVVTRAAISMRFPLDERAFLAKSGGQVRGLGKAAVQRILNDHKIDRVLAEEGGRTSRGSIQNMRNYVTFLNSLAEQHIVDFDVIEHWWIDQVLTFFAGKPFRLRVKAAWSLRKAVRDILSQAERRQADGCGVMFVGAMMQHLVGAKLELVLKKEIDQHGFSVADAPMDRPGDFLVGDVAIHVTRTPTEALIRKCRSNIDAGLRPLVVTTQRATVTTETLAENQGISDQIDVFEIEQFLATNLHEMCCFQIAATRPTATKLVEKYNRIVNEHETDPSLAIVVC